MAVSLDSLETLRAFSADVGAWYPMGSDLPERAATRAYGVPVRNGTASRCLFIVDREGVLRYANYRYNIRGDYEEVLAVLEEIAGGA